MKLSELINTLNYIQGTYGDIGVSISCAKYDAPNQAYLVSEPTTVSVEETDSVFEVSIRDWLY